MYVIESLDILLYFSKIEYLFKKLSIYYNFDLNYTSLLLIVAQNMCFCIKYYW